MVKHVVFWRLKDGAQGSSTAFKVKEMLEGLKAHIPEILELEVGLNINPSDAAWDVALYSVFDSMEALRAYQMHPEHVKVARFLGEVTLERAVVDYETRSS
ncbi:MAG: Dabb family protein [Candidatus Methanosuratincola sp.]|jgi:hypothetical protein